MGDIYEEMEKDAGRFGQFMAGAKGFVQGVRNTHATQTLANEGNAAMSTLHRLGAAPTPGAPQQGFLSRMVGQFHGGRQAAAEAHGARAATDQAATAATQASARNKQVYEASGKARAAGHEVPQTPEELAHRATMPISDPWGQHAAQNTSVSGGAGTHPVDQHTMSDPWAQHAQQQGTIPWHSSQSWDHTPLPADQRAAPVQRPTGAHPPPVPAAANPSLMQQGRDLVGPNATAAIKRYAPAAAAGAAVGAIGMTAMRGHNTSEEQQARMQDYLANAHGMQPQALPSMSVYASYDQFAASKHAALKTAAPLRSSMADTFGPTHNAFAAAFGKTLADKLVAEPIDNFHRTLKKKLVDEPKAQATFDKVIREDPILQRAYADRPDEIHQTFGAMKKFGPSMVTSPGAVRSFLRQSALSGGTMDMATIRLLAETEKFIQNSRGKGNIG